MTKTTVYLLAVFVLVGDQLTKLWAVRHLALDTPSIVLIPRVLYLTRTTNTGSAFGLFPGSTAILALAALAAAAAIVWYVAVRRQALEPIWAVALALPLGGALGNFVDRVRLGYVVDFIDLRLGTYQWPVFNLADSAICIGVALLALTYLLNGDRHTESQQASTDKSPKEPSTDATK